MADTIYGYGGNDILNGGAGLTAFFLLYFYICNKIRNRNCNKNII
ncbi:hypothetical protein [Trichormus azollae]|nr:hypothetical protein [Trichormus azollae]